MESIRLPTVKPLLSRWTSTASNNPSYFPVPLTPTTRCSDSSLSASDHPDYILFSVVGFLSRRCFIAFSSFIILVGCVFSVYLYRQDVNMSGFSVQRSLGACILSDPSAKKWGRGTMTRTRGPKGTGVRLAQFLEKAQRGSKMRIAALGGSITACREIDPQACWPIRLTEWLESTYPQSEFELTNLAKPAMQSDFYSKCLHHSVLDNIDLILLEFGVNDSLRPIENKGYDSLLRQILRLPGSPAVIALQLYSPYIGSHTEPEGATWINGNDGHSILAQYYDVPVIAPRNVLYQRRWQHPQDYGEWYRFGLDGAQAVGHHPSELGHDFIADSLISFLWDEACYVRSISPEWSLQNSGWTGVSFNISDIPPWSPFTDISRLDIFKEPTYNCKSLAEGDQLPLAEGSEAWKLYDFQDKQYLRSTKIGDVVRFFVDFGEGGQSIQLLYLKSAKLELARVHCEMEAPIPAYMNATTTVVDKGVDLSGYWPERSTIPIFQSIEYPTVTGQRIFKCTNIGSIGQTEGKSDFRFAAVAIVPIAEIH